MRTIGFDKVRKLFESGSQVPTFGQLDVFCESTLDGIEDAVECLLDESLFEDDD